MPRGRPPPGALHQYRRQREEGGPEDPREIPAAGKVAGAGVGQGYPCRVPTDPLPVDLPEEAIALVHPADAANAPLLLPLAFDLAKEAILVPELEKVFRPEKVHKPAILLYPPGKKQAKEKRRKKWRPQGDLPA